MSALHRRHRMHWMCASRSGCTQHTCAPEEGAASDRAVHMGPVRRRSGAPGGKRSVAAEHGQCVASARITTLLRFLLRTPAAAELCSRRVLTWPPLFTTDLYHLLLMLKRASVWPSCGTSSAGGADRAR